MVKLMKEANTFTLVTYRSIIQIILSLGTLLQQGKNPLGNTVPTTRSAPAIPING